MDNAVHSQHAVHSTSATVASPLDANAPRLQVPPVSVAAAHAPAASHGTAMTADPPTQPFSFKEPLPPPSTGRPMHWRSSSAPMASSSQMHFQPLPPIQKTIIRLPKLPLQQTLPSTSTSTPKPKSAKQPASARPVPASARDPLQIPTPASTPKPSDAHIPCAPADPAHPHLQPQASSVHRRTTSMPSAVLASGDSGGLDLLYETAFATHPSAASATTAPSAEPAAPAGHTAVAQPVDTDIPPPAFVFTQRQLLHLQTAHVVDAVPSAAFVAWTARILQVDPAHVQAWFDTHRAAGEADPTQASGQAARDALVRALTVETSAPFGALWRRRSGGGRGHARARSAAALSVASLSGPSSLLVAGGTLRGSRLRQASAFSVLGSGSGTPASPDPRDACTSGSSSSSTTTNTLASRVALFPPLPPTAPSPTAAAASDQLIGADNPRWLPQHAIHAMHTTHAHGAETGLMHTALAQSSSTDAAAAAARSATKRKGSPALATHDNDAHDGNRGSSAFLLPPPGADLLLQSNELLSSSSSHVTAHTPPHASTAALLLPEAIATAPKAKPSRKAPANPPASNGPTNSSGSAAKRKKPRTKPPAQTDSAALLSSSPSSGDPSSGQPVSPPVVLDTTTIEPKEIPHDAVLHLQTKQCMVATYGKSPRCRSCIRKNGDSCRFKQFRAFVESPTDKSLSYGPYFVDGQHPIVVEFEASAVAASATTVPGGSASKSRKSTGANGAVQQQQPPPEPVFTRPQPNTAAEKLTLDHVAHALYPELARESALLASHSPSFYRPRPPRLRQLCDICMASFFNCYWICCVCGAEICTTCYDEWDEAALADGRPTLLTRDHGFKIVACCHRKSHRKAQLLLAHCMPTPDFNRVCAEVGRHVASTPTPRAGDPALPRLYSRPADVNASEAAVLDKEHQIGGDIDVTNDSGDYVRIPWAAGDDARSLGRLEQDWARRMPIVLEIPVGDMQELWAPSVFAREFGTEVPEMVDCTPGIVVDGISIQSFFDGFGCAAKRPLDSQGNPMVLKLKDWPGDMDLKDKMASHYHSLVSRLPLPDFHCRNGALNLASRIPPEAQTLDLGPKLYIAYGSDDGPGGQGTTPLHLDMSDALNLMVYATDYSPSSTSSPSSPTPVAPPHLESSTPPSTSASLSPAFTPPQSRTGAVWDIYPAQAAPALRAFITQVSIERNLRIDDPIHDQRWYLDAPMRERLYREYGVRGWRIHQRPGDVIYVPAGSPHQVCNYQDCIKVAMDYMSPYHVEQSVGLTREFRRLGSTHHRKSDLLQPKNVLYHAWVDCMAALHRGDCDPAGTALPAPSASGSAEPAV